MLDSSEDEDDEEVVDKADFDWNALPEGEKRYINWFVKELTAEETKAWRAKVNKKFEADGNKKRKSVLKSPNVASGGKRNKHASV